MTHERGEGGTGLPPPRPKPPGVARREDGEEAPAPAAACIGRGGLMDSGGLRLRSLLSETMMEMAGISGAVPGPVAVAVVVAAAASLGVSAIARAAGCVCDFGRGGGGGGEAGRGGERAGPDDEGGWFPMVGACDVQRACRGVVEVSSRCRPCACVPACSGAV